ncbi:sigma 54-interacting transcriptional regulator [Effusibacillus lacus]|uniref:sigma 54-interacting transcriptional regulator n=1 Tax=Effusibacillus lacus TaxID=1348429 RepID=UPI0010EF1C07|nr:sigma 54-interacting transcriptional regulator [Effusibacillus lacus]TCS72558.1 sigma-54 interacting transcriptional regulator [Effusibacillus lacus]
MCRHQQVGEKAIINQSNGKKELTAEVERVARVESTVTIYGESGVGKELIAHAIHHFSPRADQPFVKINYGSILQNFGRMACCLYSMGTDWCSRCNQAD